MNVATRTTMQPGAAGATATATLADYFAHLELDAVPGPIVEETKSLILDTLACMIAGARTEIGPMVAAQARLFGAGEEASIAGVPTRFGMLGAAYANGRLGNCLDLDETYPGGTVGGVHVAIAAVAAALALCEQRRLGGKDFLLATLSGYELAGRVADVGTQLIIKDGLLQGMPPVWGMALPVVYAAAGAAGKALRLDAQAFEETIALAGSNVPPPIGPLWAAMLTLPNTKYCDSGWCTLAGLFAAASAALGSTGPGPILDGDRSLFRMMGMAKIDPDGLVGELGTRWAIANVTYKPWPSCRWHHQAMTALADLLEREQLRADEIESVVVEANTGFLSPRFRNQNPPNMIARQFSFPHAVAMLVAREPAGPGWLSGKRPSDPDIAALRAKVSVEAHPRASACVQSFVRDQVRQMPSGVRVKARGKVFHEEREFALGDPWDATTRWGFDDVARKFRQVTGSPGDVAEAVIQAVSDLEHRADLESVTAALRVALKPV